MSIQTNTDTFQIMTKPVGSRCNLNCDYCYYLEKKLLYPEQAVNKMSDELLEEYIKQFIESQDLPEVEFSWQGGEPTLAGLDFFKKVVELQLKYTGGKKIGNAFQTNGLLLNDDWCSFFAEHKFFIGISIDGPEYIHDKYRKTIKGAPSFKQVMKGIEFLRKHKVEYNTLTVVNNFNSFKPLEVYNFLKGSGSHFMQFIPILERISHSKDESELKLISPDHREKSRIAPWSVNPLQYGKFLNNIFDEWVRNDVGNRFVQIFDVTLASWMDYDPGLCIFKKHCGRAGVIEHSGDLYSCDHYVYPEYQLGNIMEEVMRDLMNSDKQLKFGLDKFDRLPKKCLNCNYLKLCYGGCPKHRINPTKDKDKPFNYFCKGYQLFFEHVKPYMDFMAEEIKFDRPPSNVMEFARER